MRGGAEFLRGLGGLRGCNAAIADGQLKRTELLSQPQAAVPGIETAEFKITGALLKPKVSAA